MSKILVIEDVPDTLVGTLFELESQGARVRIESNVEAAKTRLEREKYDLVLLDWRIPRAPGELVDDEAGSSILRWLREAPNCINRKTPILVVTAQKSAVDHGSFAGHQTPIAVLSKLRPKEILDEVSRLVG